MKDLLSTNQYIAQLSPQDKAFCEAACLGVVSAMPVLDEIISHYVKRFSHAEYVVQAILRLCTYELLYMEHKDFAVVSQAILLAKKLASRSKPLITKVMHELARIELPEKTQVRMRFIQSLTSQSLENTLASFSLFLQDASRACGIPLWILQEAYTSRGMSFALNFASAHLGSRPLFVMSNPQGDEHIEGVELSHQFGMYVLRDEYAHSLYQKVRSSKLIASDISAQLISLCVAYELKACTSSRRILEVGAGKGTKTLSILSLCTKLNALPAEYIACDISEAKLSQNKARVERSTLDLVPTYMQMNSLSAHASHEMSYGCVFVDAPCSGLSTIRRHADTSIRMSAHDISWTSPTSLPHVQLKILKDVSAYVMQGGCLLYSTCSFSRSENEDVIDAFLSTKEGRGFRRQSFPEPWIVQVDNVLKHVYEYASNIYTKDYIARGSSNLYGIQNESTMVFTPYAYGPDAHVLTRLVRVS